MDGKVALILCVAIVASWADTGRARLRLRRQPVQKDEATEEKTNRVDIADVVDLSLTPSGQVELVDGEDLTLECKISNKPRDSQVQWYYMIRNPSDNSFDNFTILANEAATVDPNRYTVWTTPPGIYTLRIAEMKVPDTGEYCCFLYVSYSETYRQVVDVKVSHKPLPTTTPYVPPRTVRPSYQRSYGSIGQEPGIDYSPIDEIIEEAVEHDIESKLGKRLNITMIKNNAQAQHLIHNATEEIKSLLNINENLGGDFENGTTKVKITRQMEGKSSQVKTVVTTLISRISRVDASLAQALMPAQSRDYSGDANSRRAETDSSAPMADWRRIYEQYKQDNSDASEEDGPAARDPTAYNVVPSSANGYNDWDDDDLKMEEDNEVEPVPPASGQSDSESLSEDYATKRCQYQLVINEFDPSQCPSIGSRDSPAAMYYDRDNKAPAYTQQPIGSIHTPPNNDQLSRIEDRLIEEMANSKMVNKTVLMHDSMLVKTEKMLEEQTSNISKLEELVKDLRSQLAITEAVKDDMEDKVTNVMLNILEINKRLDVAMQTKGTPNFGKAISVLSASETIACDRHPNVTHYKDCSEIADEEDGLSGVYYIRPLYSACPIPVWCDMDTYPGGWTVIQRREGGAVNFNRDWQTYRKGFGHVTAEHWIGNDNLFLLTNQDSYMMRTDLWDFYDSRVYAEYRSFKIDGERDEYKLTVGNYSGTAGDGMKSHNKHKFSTRDHDNDMWQDYHCASEWEGGWWFTNCWSSYLNGQYYNTSSPPYNGISWREWKEEQLYKSEIKIRPVYHIRTASDQQGAQAALSDDPAAVQVSQPRQNVQVVRRKYNNVDIN